MTLFPSLFWRMKASWKWWISIYVEYVFVNYSPYNNSLRRENRGTYPFQWWLCHCYNGMVLTPYRQWRDFAPGLVIELLQKGFFKLNNIKTLDNQAWRVHTPVLKVWETAGCRKGHNCSSIVHPQQSISVDGVYLALKLRRMYLKVSVEAL